MLCGRSEFETKITKYTLTSLSFLTIAVFLSGALDRLYASSTICEIGNWFKEDIQSQTSPQIVFDRDGLIDFSKIKGEWEQVCLTVESEVFLVSANGTN